MGLSVFSIFPESTRSGVLLAGIPAPHPATGPPAVESRHVRVAIRARCRHLRTYSPRWTIGTQRSRQNSSVVFVSFAVPEYN